MGVFDLRDRVFSLASGLGGKLLDLLSPRGGCGNELILTVFRSVLPAALTAPMAFTLARLLERGNVVVGTGVGGVKILEGARRPLLGVDGADFTGACDGIFSVLFRVLCTGKAGNAILGGPFEDRDGRGKAVAISSTGSAICER